MSSTSSNVGAGAVRSLSWPWMLEGRDGSRTFCECRAAWLAEWRYRLRIMCSDGGRSIAARRAGLERALAVNAAVLRDLEAFGARDAVLELLGAFAAADARLAAQQEKTR